MHRHIGQQLSSKLMTMMSNTMTVETKCSG